MRKLLSLCLLAAASCAPAWGLDMTWNRSLQPGSTPSLVRAYGALTGPVMNTRGTTPGFSLDRPAFTLRAEGGALWQELPAEGLRLGLLYTGRATLSFRVGDPIEQERLKLYTGQTSLDQLSVDALYILPLGACADLPAPEGDTTGAADGAAPYGPFKNALHANGMGWLDCALNPQDHGEKDLMVLFRMDGNIWAYLLDSTEPEEVSLRRLANPPRTDSWWWDRVVSLHLTKAGQLTREIPTSEREAKYGVDVLRYDASLDFERGGKVLPGTNVRVKLDLKRPLRGLYFTCTPILEISSVKSGDGTELAFVKEQFSRKNFDMDYGLVVQLPPDTRPGPLELTFAFTGDLCDSEPGYQALRDSTEWYPNLEDADGASFGLSATVPKGYEVLGVGELVDHRTGLPDERESWSWEMKEKIRVSSFLFGKLTHWKKTFEGIEVDVALADNVRTILFTSHAKDVLEEVGFALKTYTKLFGPIPYKTLHVGMVPSGTSLGLPTLILLSDSVLARTGSSWPEQIVAHETAHQWWYNQVTPSTYRDAWVSESLAEFSSFLYMRDRHDWDEATKYISAGYHQMSRLSAIRKEPYISFGPISIGSRLYTTLDPDSAYQNIVYAKGAWILLDLSRMANFTQAGEAGFFEGLKDLVATSQGHRVSTSDFRLALERHMKVDLRWFFQQWLDSVGLPTVKVTAKADCQGDTCKVVVEGTQTGSNMTLPIPIQAAKGKKIMEYLFFLKGPSSRAEFPISFKPDKVAVDAYHMCPAEYEK